MYNETIPTIASKFWSLMPIMRSPTEMWKTYRGVLKTRRRVVLSAFLFAFIVCEILHKSEVIEVLEDWVGRPALFMIRQMAGMSPALDSRLVIYSYNDEAASEWGRPDLLPGRKWAEILGAIADHKPKAILVDMIFGNKRTDLADVAAMNRAFKRNVPIYTGAAVFANPLQRRKPFKMNGQSFRASDDSRDFLKSFQGIGPNRAPYGPADNLTQLQEHVGQINFRTPGYFMPIIPFPPDRILRHLSLSTQEPSAVKIIGERVAVNGQKLQLNSQGEAFVNWSSPKSYTENTFKIIDLVETRKNGQFSSRINTDSIVLLLPLMFTGNADYKSTFVGQLSGGYIIAAVLNSVLTGQWVHNINLGHLGILLALIMGFIGTLIRRNYIMIFYWAGINLGFIALVLASFLFSGLLIGWMNPLIGFNLLMLPVIILLEVAEEIRSIRMNDALTGVLSPKMLEQISKSPESFSLAPVEQTVTVMFVDFVGFSVVAEQIPSRLVFESLKKHFSDLGRIIHKYHGIVNKSLGDGLLGVFGFDPVTREVSNTHAEDALLCSIEIQKMIAEECATFKKSDENKDAVIFSARVGLNTGSAFIGNVGDEGRLDLTVIGHTVNMGKRFEDACEPFKILMGQSTCQYLSANYKSRLIKRDIQIKHQKDLVHCFELDPFEDNRKLYSSALHMYRDFSKNSRTAERFVVPRGQVWEIYQSGLKTGIVINYSETGVCVELASFYGNKVTITLDIIVKSASDGRIEGELQGLRAAVKWGRKSDTGYRHGLVFSDESAPKFKIISENV